MKARLIAVAIAVGGLALGLWYWPLLRGSTEQSTPMLLPSVGGELFFLRAPEITRRGSDRIVVLRLSGPARLTPYHFQQSNLSAPLTATDWAKRLDAPVVFNAGQFDENLQHLGWLKSDGTWVSRQRKQAWKGLLVSDPEGEAAWGRVVDLQTADPSVAERYRNVVQSMMLVDHDAQVRVRDSDLTACRTVVGEDSQGRLLVILTEGATTLADLARWLPTAGLSLVRAMNLDGGIESQLHINTPELTLSFYGQYGTNTTVLNAQAGSMIRYPLPAVIAWQPARSAAAPTSETNALHNGTSTSSKKKSKSKSKSKTETSRPREEQAR